MGYRLCQTCNPLPPEKIFIFCTQEEWETIHRQPSDCEREIDEINVLSIGWEEIKNEDVLPEDYTVAEPSEPDVILPIQDRVGNLARIANCLFDEFQINILAGQINGQGCSENGMVVDIQFTQEKEPEQVSQRLEQLYQRIQEILNIQSTIEYRNRDFQQPFNSRRLCFRDKNNDGNSLEKIETRRIRLVAVDRLGLTADIANCLHDDFQANIIGGHMVTNDRYATFEFEFYLESFSTEYIEDILNSTCEISSVFVGYLYPEEQ